MNTDEIVRILLEEYGIQNMDDLDRKIGEQMSLNTSIFLHKPKEDDNHDPDGT